MTPEERDLVIQLFDRLAALEDAQRDPDAERLIRDGLRQAPNAPYALVQTVLVQDDALKRADARIRELEGAAPARETSFLGGDGRRGSVPSVRAGEAAAAGPSGMSPAWRTGTPAMAPQGAPAPEYGPAPMGHGGSFLGTAAAAAAGMIGGSLLMSGIRSMMGHSGSAHAAYDPAAGGASPWAGGAGSAAGGELSRQAGLDDIGRAPSSTSGGESRGYGLLDDGPADVEQDEQDAGDGDDVDSGGGGGDE
jgi:hypothetical protein